MLVQTKGIIVRSLKYSETSLILDVLTESLGKRSFIISGVRKKRSKTQSGILQIMNQVELLVYDKDPKKLNRIKEAKALRYYRNIPFDPVKRSLGIFMTEMIQRTIREPEQNLSLYEFVIAYFNFLDKTQDGLANFAIGFMLEYSRELGFYPHNNWSANHEFFNLMEGNFSSSNDNLKYDLDRQRSLHILQLINGDKQDFHLISIPKLQRNQLLHEMIRFYQIHVEGFGTLKSISILSELHG